MMSRFLFLHPSFTKKETFKKFMEVFKQYTNMCPMYSMLYAANLGLCDYVLFSQIRSQLFSSVVVFFTDKLSYKIDKDQLVVSKLFTILNSVKIQLGISDWGIKRSTLEDGN